MTPAKVKVTGKQYEMVELEVSGSFIISITDMKKNVSANVHLLSSIKSLPSKLVGWPAARINTTDYIDPYLTSINQNLISCTESGVFI